MGHRSTKAKQRASRTGQKKAPRPLYLRWRWLWRGALGTAILLALSLLPVLYLRFLPAPTSAFMWRHSHGSDQSQLDNLRKRPTRYRWIPRQDIPGTVALAAMASEDQRFPSHHGVDGHELRNAVAGRLMGDPLRGASTITQQVAKNLFLWPGRNLARKALELYYASAIELLWPKARILEMYINIAEFGSGLYGIQEAALAYYGLEPKQLNAAQSAWLITQLPAPSRYDLRKPSARQRRKQRWIRKQMHILKGMGHLKAIAWAEPPKTLQFNSTLIPENDASSEIWVTPEPAESENGTEM